MSTLLFHIFVDLWKPKPVFYKVFCPYRQTVGESYHATTQTADLALPGSNMPCYYYYYQPITSQVDGEVAATSSYYPPGDHSSSNMMDYGENGCQYTTDYCNPNHIYQDNVNVGSL